VPAANETSGDGAQGSSDLRINPTGSENLAYLTVQLPTGTCVAGGTCGKPLAHNPVLTLDGATLAFGSQQRIKKGDHVISVDGATMTVTLAAKEKRVVTLAVAHRKCVAASLPNVDATDFGATPVVSNVACPAAVTVAGANANPFANGATLSTFYSGTPGVCNGSVFFQNYTLANFSPTTCQGWTGYTIVSASTSTTGRCGAVNINAAQLCNEIIASNFTHLTSLFGADFLDQDLSFAPIAYQWNLSNATSGTVTFKEGQITEVPVTLPVVGTLPAEFKTRIDFATTRELPDYTVASIRSSVAGEKTYSLPASANASLNLKAYVNTAATYTLTAAGRTVTLDQSKDNVIKLNRLDVDDVTITREDGTTYVVKGTYELYFGGTLVSGPAQTHTGIDALPGDYEVVIKYTTDEGPQVDRQTITL
jgi:hypothetical protein